MRARTDPALYHQALILGLLLAILSPIALAEPAGQVVFATGSGTATDSQGNTRTLEKDAAVEEGDTILTKDGLVQIRFKDGAFLALQPQTEFKVERYRYTAAGDAQDGVIMSLVKGGLRTISGLVGKRDRSAYSMKAAVATIGIRGTDYALELSDRLIGNVAEGAIEVCNGAGCLGVLAGQAFLVPSLTEIPVLTERHVFLPPTQPRDTAKAHKREAAADDQRPIDEAALEHAANGKAKEDAALERALAPAPAKATATAGSDKSVSSPGRGAAIGSTVNPVSAVTAPPGQAKKAGADDTPLASPTPASSPSVPPGQAKKVGADNIPLASPTPASSPSVPPGQAKKSGADDIRLVLPAPASSPSVPPGQLKKLDAGVLESATTKPGKGVGPPGGIPPGQAKR